MPLPLKTPLLYLEMNIVPCTIIWYWCWYYLLLHPRRVEHNCVCRLDAVLVLISCTLEVLYTPTVYCCTSLCVCVLRLFALERVFFLACTAHQVWSVIDSIPWENDRRQLFFFFTFVTFVTFSAGGSFFFLDFVSHFQSVATSFFLDFSISRFLSFSASLSLSRTRALLPRRP